MPLTEVVAVEVDVSLARRAEVWVSISGSEILAIFPRGLVVDQRHLHFMKYTNV